jgi:integrase
MRDYEEKPPWLPFWKGKSYAYDFRVEGQRFRRSTGVCDRAAFEVAVEVAKGVHDAAWARALSPVPTFQEAADLYVARIRAHESELVPIVDYFGAFVRVDEIDPFMIEECIAALSRHHWSSETARRQVEVPLRAVLNYALGKRPKEREDNPRQFVFGPEMLERLIDVAFDPPSNVRDPDRRLLKMIVFMVGSGATPGETFAVRAQDINRRTGEVWIRGVETGAGKTRYRSRMVWLPDRAWALIGDLPDTGRAFLSPVGKEIIPDGKRGHSSSRQFRKLCEAAGIGVDEATGELPVVYSLRHTWATFYSSQVLDHFRLIDRGGWADADMALRYRKLPTRDLASRLYAHGWDFGQDLGNFQRGAA